MFVGKLPKKKFRILIHFNTAKMMEENYNPYEAFMRFIRLIKEILGVLKLFISQYPLAQYYIQKEVLKQ